MITRKPFALCILLFPLSFPAHADEYDVNLPNPKQGAACQAYMANLSQVLQLHRSSYQSKKEEDLARLVAFLITEQSNIMECHTRYQGTPLGDSYKELAQQQASASANTYRMVDHKSEQTADKSEKEQKGVLQRVAESNLVKLLGTVTKIVAKHYLYGI